MDEKISLKAVDQYSELYASKIVASFFSSRERITGAEILSLSEIQQVNLFIIRELLYAWKAETEKFKSPYFNYQAKQVVDAMNTFQNTLSNNISISKVDFLPLVKKAASETIYLIMDPYDFYSDALDRHGKESIPINHLKSDIKYLRINRAPLEKLVQKLEEKKITTISGNEAFGLLDSILEEVNFTPEDIDGYLNQFSSVVPLEIDKLYNAKAANKVKASQPTPAVVPVERRAPEPVERRVPEPVERRVPEPVERPKQPKPITNNFQKILRIKDSLTINQKFMFTKILFHGDFEIFSQAIDRLDTLDTLAQAKNYLDKTYEEWDKEGEEYLEFMDLIEKRFA
jgi:hypothetical protein